MPAFMAWETASSQPLRENTNTIAGSMWALCSASITTERRGGVSEGGAGKRPGRGGRL